MTDLRTAAQQALEAMEAADVDPHSSDAVYKAINALKAALAQQAEPLNLRDPAVQKRLATQWGYVPAAQAEPVEPVAHRVVAGALFDFMGWLTSRRERLVLSSTDDAAPAVDAIKDFAEMRGLSLDDAKVQDWNAALAQQAEPVQDQRCRAEPRSDGDFVCDCKIGDCPGRSAEPVAQFDLNTMPGQADAHLRALLRYTENFYATAIEHGMRARPTANAIAHVERAGKALHQIVHAQAKMLEPARPVEPVEPVAWECKAGGLKPLTQRQYDAQTAATKRHYTRIAPPQRQPLTEEEIEACRQQGYAHAGFSAPFDFGKAARAVEKASWEKNHG